jgi:hypothetical protein
MPALVQRWFPELWHNTQVAIVVIHCVSGTETGRATPRLHECRDFVAGLVGNAGDMGGIKTALCQTAFRLCRPGMKMLAARKDAGTKWRVAANGLARGCG